MWQELGGMTVSKIKRRHRVSNNMTDETTKLDATSHDTKHLSVKVANFDGMCVPDIIH